MSTPIVLPPTQRQLTWIQASTSPFKLTESAPIPQPGPGEVLVQVYAAGLNPVDWKNARFNFLNQQLPSVVGYDLSGIVVSLGSGVNQFKAGDAVFGNSRLDRPGCFQSYTTVGIDRIAIKPVGVSHSLAGSLGVAFISAWLGLVQVKDRIPGSWVYIPGGSGGVGHFAVQIVKAWNGRVITSSSKNEYAAIVKDQLLGNGDHVFNFKQVSNISEEIFRIVGTTGVDFSFDPTYNEDSIIISTSVVKSGGAIIVLGAQPQPNPELEAAEAAAPTSKLKLPAGVKLLICDLVPYSTTELSNFSRDCLPALIQAGKWIESGILKPWISRIIELDELIAVEQEMKLGLNPMGKQIVKMRPF